MSLCSTPRPFASAPAMKTHASIPKAFLTSSSMGVPSLLVVNLRVNARDICYSIKADPAGGAPRLMLCRADHAAKCGTIDEIPEQRTSRRREAAKRCTEDPSPQHWGDDKLSDTPEESCPEHPLEDGR